MWPRATEALEGIACETVFEACNEEECDVEVQVCGQAERYGQRLLPSEQGACNRANVRHACGVPSALLADLLRDTQPLVRASRAPRCRCSASL